MFVVFGYIIFMVFVVKDYIQYVCGWVPHKGYGAVER
jgi:hypothetical protein